MVGDVEADGEVGQKEAVAEEVHYDAVFDHVVVRLSSVGGLGFRVHGVYCMEYGVWCEVYGVECRV